MGDKKTTGVLVVLTSCGDPSKEDAFNKWYNDDHIPEILATGCYYAAYRYENTRPKDDQPKYLALYETDWDDPVDAFKELRKRLKGENFADIQGFGTLTYLYIGPEAEGVTEMAKKLINV